MVVAVWGTNFVVIKLALPTLSPLLLGVLRFTLVLVQRTVSRSPPSTGCVMIWSS